MSRDNFEDCSVDLTDDDKAKYLAQRKSAHAEIGKLAIVKTRINQRIKDRTQDAEKTAANCTNILRAGAHVVTCRVELDHYEGKARYFRDDTGAFVRTRSLTKDERQSVLDFDTAPPVPARGSSGKLADASEVTFDAGARARLKDGKSGKLADVPAETTWQATIAEAARLHKVADSSVQLLVRFGEEGAHRVLDAVKAGVGVEAAIEDEQERQRLEKATSDEGASSFINGLGEKVHLSKDGPARFEKPLTAGADAVLQVLNAYGQGAGEIAERCGLSEASVAEGLAELKKAGKAKTLRGTGKWVVVLGSDE